MKLFKSAALAMLLAVCATACDDDNDVTAPTDRIVLAPSQSSATVPSGGSAEIAITVTRPIGYTGPIALVAENLPAGVTGSFTPATLDADQTVSLLILSASPGATSGTSEMTIRASGTDIQSQTTTIALAVGNDASPGSFTISVNPGTVSLPKGGAGSASVSIARTGGYTGAVAFSVTGFAAGINVSVSPGTTSSNNATVQVTVDNTTPSGSYSGSIIAQGPSGGTQSAPFSVTVTSSIRQ